MRPVSFCLQGERHCLDARFLRHNSGLPRRSLDRALDDFDFFGNQLSAQVSDVLPELDFCGDG